MKEVPFIEKILKKLRSKFHDSSTRLKFFPVFFYASIVLLLISFILLTSSSSAKSKLHTAIGEQNKLEAELLEKESTITKLDTKNQNLEQKYNDHKSRMQPYENLQKEEAKKEAEKLEKERLEKEKAEEEERKKQEEKEKAEQEKREKEEAEALEKERKIKNASRQKQNALKAAENYISFMPFSKKGLYNQLTSEHGSGYSHEAAQFAIDNLEVDYKEMALKSARNYQDFMPMSDNELYRQLTSEYGEQFTHEEAQYAIDNLD